MNKFWGDNGKNLKSEQILEILEKIFRKLLSKICRKILRWFWRDIEKILRSNRKTVPNNVCIKILNQINIGAFIKQIKIDTKEIFKN